MCLRKTRSGRSRDYRDVIVHGKCPPVLKAFHLHSKTQKHLFCSRELVEKCAKPLTTNKKTKIRKYFETSHQLKSFAAIPQNMDEIMHEREMLRNNVPDRLLSSYYFI